MNGTKYGIKHKEETFRFLIFAWDVAKAWSLVGWREPDGTINVAEAAKNFGWVRIDKQKVVANPGDYDTTLPVLAVNFPKYGELADQGGIYIDGWHRLYSAVMTGVETMPVYVLTEEEERACRLAPTDHDLHDMYTMSTCMACGEEQALTNFRASKTRHCCDECYYFLEEHNLLDNYTLTPNAWAQQVKDYRERLTDGVTIETLRQELVNAIAGASSRFPVLDTYRAATALKFLAEGEE